MARVPQTAERERLRTKVEAAARAACRVQGPGANKNAIARRYEGQGVSIATLYRWVDAIVRGAERPRPAAAPRGEAGCEATALEVRHAALVEELRRVRGQRDAALTALNALLGAAAM